MKALLEWGAKVSVVDDLTSGRLENIQGDIVDLVRILYDAVGGQKHYRHQPMEIKSICRGLKRSLILKKFRTAGQLREYLETLEWQ